MNSYAPPNARRLRCHLAVFATIAWAMLLALVPLGTGAQSAVSPNLSLQASVLAPQLDLVAVHGEGFTPGGLVRLSIVSSAGIEWQLWTVASGSAFTPHSSIDPGMELTTAGIIDEAISLNSLAVYGPNGSQDPAQGYVDLTGPDQAVYGPNGSQDPAQGYVAAAPSYASGRVTTCSLDLDVQALDAQTGLMSTLVEVHPTCAATSEHPQP